MVQLLVMSIKFISQFLNLVPQGLSWSRHQNCKRFGYSYYPCEFMSISCLSTGATRINPGHDTKIARGFARYKEWYF